MSSSALRTSVLPVEHLEAELIAAPIVSPVAFGGALVSLDPRVRDDTARLWRATEVGLLGRFPGMSIDELVVRRDRAWFGDHASLDPVGLHAFLRRIACDRIDAAAGAGRLHGSDGGAHRESRRRWRWMAFALPQDLLLAAAGSSCDRIELVSPTLRATLADRGFAETHLHLKAAIRFPYLWASCVRGLADPGARSPMFESPGAELDEGRMLAPWVLRAALARLYLAAFLLRSPPSSFGAFFRERVCPDLASALGPTRAMVHSRALRDLEAGQLANDSPSFGALREAYAAFLGGGASTVPASTNGASDLDPMGHWFSTSSASSPEFSFMRAALDYLATRGSGDAPFARVFWQCVRARTFLYRHVVQRPMTPGLQWFTRTYARLAPPRRAIGVPSFIREAVELSGPGLESLEVRLVPEETMPATFKQIDDIDRAAGALKDRPEVGIVFHFPRTRGALSDTGCPPAFARLINDDPRALRLNPSGYRYGGYYAGQRASAAALGSTIMTFPRVLEVVRGLDLCTDELGVPLWVMVPLVEHVRDAADCASSRIRKMGLSPVQPLRLTIHVGEDFVHLLGGLRRVGEAIAYLRIGEGDRIGHAVALGVDVDEWGARARGIAVPAGERLLDLAWAWTVVVDGAADPLRSWLPWLGFELERIGACVFPGLSPRAAELAEMVRRLHDPRTLEEVRFPAGPTPVLDDACDPELELLVRWLTGSDVHRRAQELLTVDTARDVPLVRALQAHVRALVAERGIVVEINPTSNLLIGHLGELTKHPLWRLAPPSGQPSEGPAIRVCIGSDDPITFATSLPEEYQLLWDALVEGGLPASKADSWLDSARACGMSARFTVPRSGAKLNVPRLTDRIPLIP